jgi:hypothetical protein
MGGNFLCFLVTSLSATGPLEARAFSVIVNDFNFVGVTILPPKAHAPLVVYSNTVLPNPIALKRLKTISGRRGQIGQPARRIQPQQLSSCNSFDGLEFGRAFPRKEPPGVRALE